MKKEKRERERKRERMYSVQFLTRAYLSASWAFLYYLPLKTVFFFLLSLSFRASVPY